MGRFGQGRGGEDTPAGGTMGAKTPDPGETWAPGSRMASRWRGNMGDGVGKSVGPHLSGEHPPERLAYAYRFMSRTPANPTANDATKHRLEIHQFHKNDPRLAYMLHVSTPS